MDACGGHYNCILIEYIKSCLYDRIFFDFWGSEWAKSERNMREIFTKELFFFKIFLSFTAMDEGQAFKYHRKVKEEKI